MKVNRVVLHINKKSNLEFHLILQATSVLENKKHDAALKITARYIIQNEIIVSNSTNAHQFSFFPMNAGTNSPGPEMETDSLFYIYPDTELQGKINR